MGAAHPTRRPKDAGLKVQINDQLANTTLDEMMAEIDEDRTNMHPSVTDLTRCLTQTYLNRHQKANFTRQTKNFFLIGLGLERALLVARKKEETYGENLGIHYHVDSRDEGLFELKSTRASKKKMDEGDFPESWLKQTMSYLNLIGGNTVDLGVVFLIPAQFEVYRLTFEQRELEENLMWLLSRRDEYNKAVESGVPPESYKWNQEYECKNCQYSIVCQLRSGLGVR